MRFFYLSILCVLGLCSSCIEPPLKLPAEEVLVDMPVVITDMEVVWRVETDWRTEWHYGWDMVDEGLWGPIDYQKPSSFEVRRYYLGSASGGAHSREGMDAFVVTESYFRRTYQFGYYDLLLWSNIDSDDGTQVVVINDDDLDEVVATTTVTRGITRTDKVDAVTALFNQPEVFYSAYPRDIYISRNFDDYDYYNEAEGVWVKQINTTLNPLVYIYLVQVVLHHNDGRIVGCTGDAAVSAFASGTSVNTGHTNNKPCMVYFGMRMKPDQSWDDEQVDILGGRLTTFGLCDMEGWKTDTRSQYQGSRTELPNYLLFTLSFSNGTEQTLQLPITEQLQSQCHGGVVTVHLDVRELEPPQPDDPGEGNQFVPSIDDYEEVIYEIPL